MRLSHVSPVRLAALAMAFALTAPSGIAAQTASDPIDALKADTVGVTGSGEAMVLHLRGAGGGERIVGLGQVYADGWVLKTLSASSASFIRDGVTRQIGLNPSGLIAASTPTAPSRVSIAGGIDDLLRSYSGVALINGQPVIKLGTGGNAPILALGDRLPDGWKLVQLGRLIVFERNGEYRMLGFDAQQRPFLGEPNQSVLPNGVTLLELTPPSFPADLMQLSEKQRLEIYQTTARTLTEEGRARYGTSPPPWNLDAAMGLERAVDRYDLLDRIGPAAMGALNNMRVLNPSTDQPAGAVSPQLPPRAGPPLVSDGAH